MRLACKCRGVESTGMTKELLLAAFLIGVGLCLSGAGTHLYQMLSKQQAMLRYDGLMFMGLYVAIRYG